MDSLLDFLLSFYGPIPYAVVFGILLACGLGLPIPEDITLIAAGALAYYGVTDVWIMIYVSFAGVMIGDSFVFFLGKHYGRSLTKLWLFRRALSEERLLAASERFRSPKGSWLLFAARFMPGLRAPIFFSAGVLHVPYTRFLVQDGGAALLSVPAIVYATYYYGDYLEKVISTIKSAEYGILGVIGVVLAFTFWKWKKSKRNPIGAGPSA
jgi:membrane protein DedA with SNARE-associated domain